MSKHEIEIIDRSGTRRVEGSGYTLRDGERLASIRVPMVLMDSAPREPGRFTLTDGDTAQIGDAVATDMCGGLERIRFGDGTSAVKQPHGGWRYFAVNGQSGIAMSLDQLAHDAKVRGGSEAFGAAIADRHVADARRDAAFEKLTDHLGNAWRGEGAPPSRTIADGAAAHAAMVDGISNAWRG